MDNSALFRDYMGVYYFTICFVFGRCGEINNSIFYIFLTFDNCVIRACRVLKCIWCSGNIQGYHSCTWGSIPRIRAIIN